MPGVAHDMILLCCMAEVDDCRAWHKLVIGTSGWAVATRACIMLYKGADGLLEGLTGGVHVKGLRPV